MANVIRVRNATVNNLQGVSADIPRETFTCFVGRSGSGKSSFGVDVLLHGCCASADGQTRTSENVVLDPLPAIAVRQRLQFDHSLRSAAKVLGVSTAIMQAVEDSASCLACAGNGAQARLLPERAVVEPGKSFASVALHPLLRPVVASVGPRLPNRVSSVPFCKLTARVRDQLLFGPPFHEGWRGLENEILGASLGEQLETSSSTLRKAFFRCITCPQCEGSGVQGGPYDLWEWLLSSLAEHPFRSVILHHLETGVLDLSSPTANLSAGELQWLRLVCAVRDASPGMLVLLDEPTAGMCADDASRVCLLCHQLVEHGCTVVAIEHSPTVILSAQHILEFGPGGGANGGRITFSGPRKTFVQESEGLPEALRESIRRDSQDSGGHARPKAGLAVGGTQEYGFDGVDIRVPEKTWTCISGAIGVGKSGAIDLLFRAMDKSSGAWLGRIGLQKVDGRNKIRRPHLVDQAPIGLNPHSIPLTYIDAMTALRRLFVELAEIKGIKYSLADFSFNTAAGRCRTCGGYGAVKEVVDGEEYWQPCLGCGGTRYRNSLASVTYHKLSIGEILKLTVDQAAGLLREQPAIARKLSFLQRVGLGYLVIGQPSITLSGGEAQRVKIARQLAKKLGDRGLYLLDTPSRGLSLIDASFMAEVFQSICGRNTVVIADNHPRFVKGCDWLLVLGRSAKVPRILYAGPPGKAPRDLLEGLLGIEWMHGGQCSAN
jgi:excinuclease UvrABC ATPase subunit